MWETMPISESTCRSPDRADRTDADRFRDLVRAHTSALLGYSARRLDRAGDAADVVAEVFTVAWRRIGDVPGGDEARPWLFGVARHVIANRRRGERRHGRLVERLRQELATMQPAAPPIDAVLAVEVAMKRLPSDDVELLRLTCWEGLSPSEIATATGLAPGTVRSRLHRARQRLRALLADADDSAPDGERSATSGHVRDVERSLGTEHEDQS